MAEEPPARALVNDISFTPETSSATRAPETRRGGVPEAVSKEPVHGI